MNLFLTADQCGIQTGGGLVCRHESDALGQLSQGIVPLWDRAFLKEPHGPEPWGWDKAALAELHLRPDFTPKLVHVYSGSFPETAAELKRRGSRITWTVAAHDREVSREEHEKTWGVPFNYPHLTDPKLWSRYIEGYRLADVIICPSTVAAKTVRVYGGDFASKRIVVIPHGCDLPERTKTPPKEFVVGNLGSWGADKGIPYLLQAWKKLNYPDARLVLGGRDSTSPGAEAAVRRWGGGSISLLGWVKDVADFYGQISLYIQPSATEGFGLEVVEAYAHARPVLCSTGAGAQDIVPAGMLFPARDADALAAKIDWVRKIDLRQEGLTNRLIAEYCTWEKVRAKYQKLWKEFL